MNLIFRCYLETTPKTRSLLIERIYSAREFPDGRSGDWERYFAEPHPCPSYDLQCVSKRPLFIFWVSLSKNKPLIIIFGLQNRAKFSTRLLETCPLHLNNVASLPCEEQLIWCCLPNSRQKRKASTGCCQSNPPIAGEGLKIQLTENFRQNTQHIEVK